MDNRYCLEDFRTIVPGESTFHDVYEVTSNGVCHVTSYGGYSEYPLKDGGILRIKFYGKDLVVGEIEVLLSSEESSE